MATFFDVQTALYKRLIDNPALAELATGVYDYVPDATVYPYVVLDESSFTRDAAVDQSRRFLLEQTVRAFSNDALVEKGWRQVRDIADVVWREFEAKPLYLGQQRLQTLIGRGSFVRGEGSVRMAALVVQVYFF